MHQNKGIVRHGQNEALFEAVETSLLATFLGTTLHIHAEGLRGTGKTTILRGAKQIRPTITRVKGCLYNCDPARPHCPQHSRLSNEELQALGTEQIPMPFVEISQSAKIGTVVGSIDLARLTGSEPSACLLPGLIAQAHRGILFVDEINRLADTSPELVDVLLDVMGTKPGRIQIEETGIPKVELPVQVSVWAASNPDEEPGDLAAIRRQLSDRFDLAIPVQRPTDIDTVANILRQGVKSSDSGFEWKAPCFPMLASHFSEIVLEDDLFQLVATMYVDFNIESIRAMEALILTSRLDAARKEHKIIQLSDLRRNLPLVLSHRMDISVIDDMVRFLQEHERSKIIQLQSAMDPAHAVNSHLTAANEEVARPISGPAVSSRDYRETPLPFSEMLNHLMQRLIGHKITDYNPDSVPYAPPTRMDTQGQRAGTGITGGHQTGVGPGVSSGNTDLPPVAPSEVAKPMELLRYTELIKGPEDLRP